MASMTVTPEEQKLCKSLTIEEEIAEVIKEHTGNPIQRLPGFGKEGEVLETPGDGICSECNEDESYEFIDDYTESFKEEGYLLFLFENDEERKFLGVLKGKDDFDIIRYRNTNGLNSELATAAIVDKLQSWRNEHDFFIIGVGMDWLMAGFNELPDDVGAFAKEVYAFSPDVVDHAEVEGDSIGGVSELAKQIEEAEGFFLWWD